MNVAQILKTKGSDVLTVAADVPLGEVARTLTERRIGAVIVSEPGKPVAGILSERDIVRAIASKGAGALESAASEVMTPDVICCDPGQSIDQVMAMMTDRRIRHLPVLQDGALKGIISIGDVVKLRIEETVREAEALKDYIATG